MEETFWRLAHDAAAIKDVNKRIFAWYELGVSIFPHYPYCTDFKVVKGGLSEEGIVQGVLSPEPENSIVVLVDKRSYAVIDREAFEAM